MATYTRAPAQTFEVTEAITKHLRVKLNAAGTVSIAAAADSDIGVTNGYAHAAGDHVGVDLASLEGTSIGIADVAITTGDKLYGAAGGEIGKTNTNAPVGIALNDAAAGEKVEFIRRQI